MKVLVQNYSSPLTTEPLYLTECMKRIGIESSLWADNNVATFDIFDTYKPDVFISNFAFLTEDIIKYLSQNNSIKMLLNVTGTSKDHLAMILQTLDAKNIKNYHLFTNNFRHPHGDSVEKILPCCDVFISCPPPQFKIPLAVVTNDKNEKVEGFIDDKEVYHLVSYGKKEEWSDYTTDIRSFWGLAKCYDEVKLIDDGLISTSQFFFQATMLCNKFSIMSQSNDQRDAFEEILSELFTPEETSESVESIVKKQISKNHTCFNRTSQVLKMLGMEEKSKELLEILG